MAKNSTINFLGAVNNLLYHATSFSYTKLSLHFSKLRNILKLHRLCFARSARLKIDTVYEPARIKLRGVKNYK